MPSSRLQETILTVYRGCCDHAASEFKEWAMEISRSAVGFDSGIWVTADVVSDCFDCYYLFHQPQEMMENYDKTIRISGDFIAQAVASNIGRTINSNDLMPHHEFIQQPSYLQHSHNYGIEYILSTCHIYPVTGIPTAIAFYRSDPNAPFSEADRKTTELLVPHLIEAMRINLFFYLHGSNNALENRALAICDPQGRLYETTQRFPEVLREVWPDWNGPQLGLPFESLNGQRINFWTKDGLKFEATPCRDLYLLSVAREDVLDRLTPRQIEVARLLVDGKTYKNIARKLAITPSTVTKHVNEIHSRLKIDGREGLIGLFAQRMGATRR